MHRARTTESLRPIQTHVGGRPHRNSIRVEEDILNIISDTPSLSTREVSQSQ